MTRLKCYRNVAIVFAVCVIDCTREEIKKKTKENYSQTLQYTFHDLWNLTHPRMNLTNSKITILRVYYELKINLKHGICYTALEYSCLIE